MASDEPTMEQMAADARVPASAEKLAKLSADELRASASDPSLTEDAALRLLQHNDLPAEVLERIGKNKAIARSRKAKLALVEHPRTPRHISVPMLRGLFTFDLMRVALAPVVPADVKIAAEETLIHRLETISSGEKLSLARRASGRISAQLLLDTEARVVSTALENSRLTEAAVIRILTRGDAPAKLVELVCHHAKWSVRREIRIALLRNGNTSLARALDFARSLPAALLPEILDTSRLPADIKAHLLRDMRATE
jgi:predicted regulator of amino acid metabolism with ACT domain